jgi:indolepyruvate ferredoxin oxidoreductase beta subunit
MKTVDFIVVGVGGQGTLLASDVIAQVGLGAGLEAKKSEVHGMAQRGGSVISHVRWGERVYSPLIGKGEADFLLAFEKLDGVALVNEQAIPPVAVSSGGAEYPSDERFLAAFKAVTDKVYLIPSLKVAQEVGSARVNNVVMLGALSALLDVDEAVWRAAIEERVPPKFVEMNLRAFERGRALVK